jgi:hypothetical protein
MMRTKTLIAMAILAAVFPSLALLRGAAHDPPARVPLELAKAKRDAARTTYEVVWRNNREGFIPFAEVAYRWSRRWLEAELELSAKKPELVAAYQAHWERMRDLSRITHDRYQNRVNTVDEVSASDFYRFEAQIWLEQAKKK